jgi:hypothetical protein
MANPNSMKNNPFAEAQEVLRYLRVGVPFESKPSKPSEPKTVPQKGFVIYPDDNVSREALFIVHAAMQNIDARSDLAVFNDRIELIFGPAYKDGDGAPVRQLEQNIKKLRDTITNAIEKQEDGRYRLRVTPPLQNINVADILDSLFKDNPDAVAIPLYSLPAGHAYIGHNGHQKTEVDEAELKKYLRHHPEIGSSTSAHAPSSYQLTAAGSVMLAQALGPVGGRDTVN